MKLGNFSQQAGERESYTVHYEDDLASGDRLTDATAQASPDGVQHSLFVFDNRVRIWCEGGVVGTRYQFALTVYTEQGRILIDHFSVRIRQE